MFNRLIYTLYLISRKRKLGSHYLMAGGSLFFIIILNILTLWISIELLGKIDFFETFSGYDKKLIVILTLFFFFAFQLYTFNLIRRNRTEIKRLRPVYILAYAISSFILFIFITSLAAINR